MMKGAATAPFTVYPQPGLLQLLSVYQERPGGFHKVTAHIHHLSKQVDTMCNLYSHAHATSLRI